MAIDFILIAAMCLDLTFKYFKYKKVKQRMPNCKRYQYNTTVLKYVLYAIIFAISIAYYALLIYLNIKHIQLAMPKITLLFPVINYYLIWDLCFHGIYYNKHGVFYKQEYIEFRKAMHIYRDLVKNHYEYEIVYRTNEGAVRTMYMKVPNEKEAYELLSMIPFEEEEAM